jgi:tetratricopeptide (TPR) repeat protein
VLLAGRALAFYLSKLLVPVKLTFIYPRWHIDAGQLWQHLFPAGALAVAGLLWGLRHRLGRGPLAAYLCFAITLFPALGFFAVYPFRYSFVADHFQYLACAAPLAVLAGGAALAARRASHTASRWLGAPLLVALAGLTWSQAQVYHDVITLFEDTLRKNPACWMARNNLGTLFLKRGQVRKAEQQFRRCLEVKPDHLRARRGLAQALFRQNRADEARAELRCALDLLANQARQARSARQQEEVVKEYLAIGALFERTGDDTEAERLFRLALDVSPDWPMSHFLLGNALAKRGRFPEAIPHLRVMAEAFPDNPDGLYYLAQALHAVGQGKEAAAAARRALRLAEAEGNEPLAAAIRQRFAPLVAPAGERPGSPE